MSLHQDPEVFFKNKVFLRTKSSFPLMSTLLFFSSWEKNSVKFLELTSVSSNYLVDTEQALWKTVREASNKAQLVS